MPELNPQIVVHQHVNQKYKVQFERSAVKGVDGFRVEACSDSLTEAKADARSLYDYAVLETTASKVLDQMTAIMAQSAAIPTAESKKVEEKK